MAENKHFILVTWDFTEKSCFAFEHGLKTAKTIHHEVALVHIVKKESEIKQAETDIQKYISEKYPDISKEPTIIVKEGTIFSTISEIANEIDARMVIMGTHGIKGMQKFLGSWALKVIANSKVPFVVVQDSPGEQVYKNIVLPINFRKENKESINWAHYFSIHFGTNFRILKAKHTDSRFIKGIESNMYFINKYFKAKGISFTVEQANGEIDFAKEVIEYAGQIKANAIMVMTTKDIGFADYVLGAHEQYIIANSEKIPVICINPRPPKIGASFSTSGG